MTERDVMTLLADANPVRVDDLQGIAFPPSMLTRRPPHTRLVAVAAAAVLGAAAVASIVDLTSGGAGPPSRHERVDSGPSTIDGPREVSVAQPLAFGASPVSLPTAVAAFGPALVLPKTSLIASGDVGAVWMYTSRDGADVSVGVTFPRQGMFIQFLRPRPEGSADLAALYRRIAHKDSNFHLLDLNGVPALAADQNSDDTGHNFGVVAFPIDGAEIRVFGHHDQATLVAVARSILGRASISSGTRADVPPGGPRRQVRLPHLSRAFGHPVVLPSASLVHALGGARALALGTCPPRRLRSLYGCGIQVTFRRYITLQYARSTHLWRPQPRVRPFDLDGVRATAFRATRRSVRPAIWVVDFVIGGTNVEVSGSHRMVRPVARSIIDRSRS